jgi:hypothetical protein
MPTNPQIEVTKKDDTAFDVRITEGKSASSHHVTLSENDYQRLTAGKITREELIRRSFEFLLARESKESILPCFDLTVISRYFPQFEKEIAHRLS